MKTWTFEAIGTRWNLDFTAPEEKILAIQERVTARITEFDRTYSRFRTDSLVSQMSKVSGAHTLPQDAEPLFDLYRDLYTQTDGRFTPLIGQVMSDAGYDATYSLTPGTLSTPPAWDAALSYTYPTLTLTEPVLLDVGAAGKGYLVDIVADILVEEGVTSYIVDAGGDMRVRDSEGVRIGLEHPGDPSQAIGVVELIEGSICGSAGNRRTWGAFTHIIDPLTLSSPREILASWVMAKTALVADALATCVMLSGTDVLAEYECEYVVVYPDYTIERSPGFPAEFFTS